MESVEGRGKGVSWGDGKTYEECAEEKEDPGRDEPGGLEAVGGVEEVGAEGEDAAEGGHVGVEVDRWSCFVRFAFWGFFLKMLVFVSTAVEAAGGQCAHGRACWRWVGVWLIAVRTKVYQDRVSLLASSGARVPLEDSSYVAVADAGEVRRWGLYQESATRDMLGG